MECNWATCLAISCLICIRVIQLPYSTHIGRFMKCGRAELQLWACEALSVSLGGSSKAAVKGQML